MKRNITTLNGYRLVFCPEHHKAMFTKGYYGYVYEHILVAEKYLRRRLRDNEIVHHLDMNRSNNRFSNLLIVEDSEHNKLHAWIKVGFPLLSRIKHSRQIPKPKFCKTCGITLQHNKKFCSNRCARAENPSKRPSPKNLEEDLKTLIQWRAIAKKYGVTTTTVRRWAKAYGLKRLWNT